MLISTQENSSAVFYTDQGKWLDFPSCFFFFFPPPNFQSIFFEMRTFVEKHWEHLGCKGTLYLKDQQVDMVRLRNGKKGKDDRHEAQWDLGEHLNSCCHQVFRTLLNLTLSAVLFLKTIALGLFFFHLPDKVGWALGCFSSLLSQIQTLIVIP